MLESPPGAGGDTIISNVSLDSEGKQASANKFPEDDPRI